MPELSEVSASSPEANKNVHFAAYQQNEAYVEAHE